ncbi:hypothetical protein AgCh_034232 [Apium graveolens]
MDYPLVSRVPHMDEQANLNLREFTDKRKRAKIDIDELKACKKTRANSACTEACHVGECLMRKLQHQKISVTSDNALIGILGGFTADAGKAKALALAKDFKSENPTFILTVRPSFVDRRSQVDIKRAFAQRHMRREQNFKVNLQVEGRSWEVMCSVRRDRCRGLKLAVRDLTSR